jgi:two-component system phosphate regulon sensor histidine kinase PhoR
VRSRIFLKLLAAFVVVIVAATLILDFAIRRAWESSLREQIDNSLRVNALLFAKQINTDKQHSTQEIAADVAKVASARATVIDSSGKVLADTEADPATMENHASRPEFQSALRGEVGSSTRESRTVGVEFLYMAAPVQGGAVRLAYPLRAIAEVQQQVRRRLLVSSLIAVLIAMVLAAFASGRLAARLQKIVRFSEKISEGDLSARVEESSRDEIAQVASALDKTARRLESSFRSDGHFGRWPRPVGKSDDGQDSARKLEDRRSVHRVDSRCRICGCGAEGAGAEDGANRAREDSGVEQKFSGNDRTDDRRRSCCRVL